MLVRAGTEEALGKKKELMEYIREEDRWLYRKLRYSLLGRAANLPGKGGRKMFVAAYKVCQNSTVLTETFTETLQSGHRRFNPGSIYLKENNKKVRR